MSDAGVAEMTARSAEIGKWQEGTDNCDSYYGGGFRTHLADMISDELTSFFE